MKSRLRWYLYALVLVVLGAVAYWEYLPEKPAVYAEASDTAVDGIPLVDIAYASTTPDPADISKWFAARKKRYRALLSDWECEIVVVPVQVEAMAFDRPTRNMMTADVARVMGQRGKCVADPFLIGSALGEGQRLYSAEAVQKLAGEIKAKQIVTVFAGHNRANEMRVTLQVDRWNENRGAFGRVSRA